MGDAMTDEARLLEKLRRVEALFAGASTAGERLAAAEAKRRIEIRLKEVEKTDPPVEFRFSMGDVWSQKIFLALLRRYGLRAYRYRGQRRTTVMTKVSKRFVDETLWPAYRELHRTLHGYFDEIAERVIREAIHKDTSDAEEVEAPAGLPGASDGAVT